MLPTSSRPRCAPPPPWRAGLSCALAVFLLTVLALREPFRGWQAAVELAADQAAANPVDAAELAAAARAAQGEQPAFAPLRWAPPAPDGAAVLRVEGAGPDRRTLQERLNEFARAVRSRVSRQQASRVADRLQAIVRRQESLTETQTQLARQIEVERRQLFERRLLLAQQQEAAARRAAERAALAPPQASPPPPPVDPQVQRLRNLRDQLALLQQTRTDDHPEIVRIRAELTALERLSTGAPTTPSPPAGAPSTPGDLELLPPAKNSAAGNAAAGDTYPTRRTQHIAGDPLARAPLVKPALAAEREEDGSLAALQQRLAQTEAALVSTAAERAEAERQQAHAAQSPVRLAPATVTRRWGGAVPWSVALLGVCLALAAGAGGWRAAALETGDLPTAAAEAGLPLLGGVALGRASTRQAPAKRWLPAAVQTAELLVTAVLVVMLVGVWGSPDIAALLRSDPLGAAAMAVDYLHQGGLR